MQQDINKEFREKLDSIYKEFTENMNLLGKKYFKRVSTGDKFRQRGENRKVGIFNVTYEFFDSEFIKMVNNLTDLYFVEMAEDFETGNLMIKFEHERFDRVIEGSLVPTYKILIEDDNKTIRYLKKDGTTIEDGGV